MSYYKKKIEFSKMFMREKNMNSGAALTYILSLSSHVTLQNYLLGLSLDLSIPRHSDNYDNGNKEK